MKTWSATKLSWRFYKNDAICETDENFLSSKNRTFGYLLLVRTDQSDSPFENVARQYWELKEVLGNEGRLIICMFHLQVQTISELCNSVSLVYKKHLAVILKKKKRDTKISKLKKNDSKKEKSLGDKQNQIKHKTILRKITTWSNWGGISPPQILEKLETCSGPGGNLSTLWANIKKIKLMWFSNVTVKWILHGKLLRDTPKSSSISSQFVVPCSISAWRYFQRKHAFI